ncbi:MAG: Gfo/Idh/MocA family oxidoreductase [Kiritimatiellae bacterium]|nr:Gfo/Idh/MocA family oxidoreductase [Kiritimatiellia bacterium]
MKTTKVGIVGCGNICSIYFKNCRRFRNLEIAACADLVPERARAKAEEFGVPKACSVDELLADPAIEIVINLTIPKAHAPVNKRILEAGKHAYGEKPYALSIREADEVVALAEKKGLRTGCAPDTFLGGGIQTCRKLIDDGWIGKPIGATAFMMGHGHESWHPDPEFYYQPGGGPMFDMGPYYLTALVNLLGPVASVAAMTEITFPHRTITSEKKFGARVEAEIPTHVTGVLRFAGGAIGTIIMSFDVWAHGMPNIEIYGTEGSMRVPDPNGFGGVPRVKRAGWADWRDFSLTHAFSENSRGLGVSDMAAGLADRGSYRASGELGYHVLEVMESFHVSADQGKHVMLKSSCKRPEPLPAVMPFDGLDEFGVLTRLAREARKAAP